MKSVSSSLCLSAVLALVLSQAGCAGAKVNPWSQVPGPLKVESPAQARPIGGYSAGCLTGAESLPPDGPGFQVMRIRRGRFYGHPTLIAFIREYAAQVVKAKLGVLLVGDLSQARGGPMLSGHRSHQIGLDADLWFMSPAGLEKTSLTLGEREQLSAVSLVKPDGLAVERARWNGRPARLLKMAALHPIVERIFVNPAIKRELCLSEPAVGREWLSKIRPWWGHDYHFHVRLVCQGPECVPQHKPEAKDGCDAELDWWFSEDARAQLKASESKPVSAEIKLPAACYDVVSHE